MCITIEKIKENQKVQTLALLHCPILKTSKIKGKFGKYERNFVEFDKKTY